MHMLDPSQLGRLAALLAAMAAITCWRNCMMKFASVPVLLAVALASTGSAWAQTATPVSITLTDYAFTPSTLDLKAGVTYQLHFANSGSKDHNFDAPQFFAASQVAPEDQAKVEKGLVALDGGQSVDITVTPDRPGTFPVECTHFMHKMMGMHGNIIVQ
jgi:uncharacterized cupredoxin-like copper-binding protein